MWFIYVGTYNSIFRLLPLHFYCFYKVVCLFSASEQLLPEKGIVLWRPMPFKIFTFPLSTHVIPAGVEIYWAILSVLNTVHLLRACALVAEYLKGWQSVRTDEVYTFIECVCYPSLLAFLLAFSLYLLQTCSFFCMCFSGKLNFLNGTTCNWVSLMVEMSGKDSVGQQHLTVLKI